MQRTSEITNQLCDVLTAQAMQNLPLSPRTLINVCGLLRFVAAECAVMERRLAGRSVADFDATNVVILRANKPAGDV